MFASREDAGRRLGYFLKDEGVEADLVLGLPRGGVVVAAEVAHILNRPLDTWIVRKIGHPLHREFAIGALAENGVVILDESVVARNPLIRTELNEIIREEKQRLSDYMVKFHRQNPPELEGKSVMLVDDGLATGATTEAAVLSVKRQNAARVIVSAPVASSNAVERMQRVADGVEVLLVDPDFDAVGRYYDEFSQTSDEEVIELLRGAARHRT